MLEISKLSVSVGEKEILEDVDFSVGPKETVVLLGANGAGKSTVASAMMGDPKFSKAHGGKITGEIKFNGKTIFREFESGRGSRKVNLKTDERARLGIFCSFQNPVEVAGISTTEMIRAVFEERKGGFVPIDEVREKITGVAKKLGQNIWFSEREMNVGFSGGEKKKNEILQLLSLEPKMIILDEIDSGLDVDASGVISKILADYQKKAGCSYLVISHNMRILGHLRPSKAILLNKGRVVKVGDERLVREVAKRGFKAVLGDFKAEGRV